MNNNTLFETLLHAEHENAVIDVLDKVGYSLRGRDLSLGCS